MLHPAKTVALSIGIAAATMALSSQYVFAGATVVPLTASNSNSGSASSWIGGAQAGYNWQRGSFVYGVETDISATNLKSEMNTVLQGPIVPAPTANAHANVDWYGSFRGRLGWAQGPVLLYGTGGLAYGGVDLNSSISSSVGPRFLNSQTSAVKAGWVAGGGIEYLLRPNVILKSWVPICRSRNDSAWPA